MPLPHSSAGRPVRGVQRASGAQQRPRRGLRVVASAAPASAAGGQMSAEALAALVADKERQLASMFESGKLQPRVRMGGEGEM